MLQYEIIFTRNLNDDLEAIADIGLPLSVKSLEDYVIEEFVDFLEDGMTLGMDGSYSRNDDSQEYSLVGTISAPEKVLPLQGNPATSRKAALGEIISILQAACDGGVSGRFTVQQIDFGGSIVSADTIITNDDDGALRSGRHLTDLTAAEIFDRTKIQHGNVAIIAAGSFHKSSSIHRADTSYAVGKLDEDGLFLPIQSHLRYDAAVSLFKEAVSHHASEAVPPAAR